MAIRSSYAPGAPSWIDLAVPDLDAATAYYSALFGWSVEVGPPETGGYTLASLDGHTVAGIGRQQDPAQPVIWNTYMATDDVHVTTQRVRAAGGTVVAEPMQVLDFGSMAFCLDPLGAAFGLWQAGAMAGAELVNEPGAWSWSELATPDGATADAFYAQLFPYEFEKVGDRTDLDYTAWRINGEVVCGRFHTGVSQLPPHWIVYFAVPDADVAAQRVAELGGTVVRRPWDSPYGRMCAVTDPWGASFTLSQLPERQ